MPKLACNATIIRTQPLAMGTYKIWVKPDWNAQTLVWEAGQFLRIGVPEGKDTDRKNLRSMTIVDISEGIIEMYMVAVKEGTTSPKFTSLQIGHRCFVDSNITGNFTAENIPKEIGCNLWLMATGTGIAPFIAMLRNSDEHLKRFENIVLVHSVRQSEQLNFGTELLGYQQSDSRFIYIPVVTRQQTPSHEYLSHRVTTLIQNSELETYAAVKLVPEDSVVMLCGNPNMIWDTLQILQAKGLKKHRRRSPGNIMHERYW